MWSDLLKNEKFLFFAGGVAVAVAGAKALKSKKLRNMCVKSMAAGMKLQKDAEEAFQNMKEEAADMCFDARKEITSTDSKE